MQLVTAIASAVTAVAVIVSVIVTLGIHLDNNETNLKIAVGAAGVSPEKARQGQAVSIRVVNHSRFATTIRGVHIRNNDGSTLLVHPDTINAKWVTPETGTPARVESREEIVVDIPKEWIATATHVEASTVDGHTATQIISVSP